MSIKENKNEIFKIYDTLCVGRSSECIEWHKQVWNLSKPVSIWQVDDNYYDSKYRLLLVGKAARGEVAKPYPDFMDATEYADDFL